MKGRLYTEYRSRSFANDTYAVTLEQVDGEPIPIDQMQFKRRGNSVNVRGQWRDESAADAVAKAAFEKDYTITW